MDWFYNHKGKLQGPFSSKHIQELIRAGSLGPDDLVYAEGTQKWRPISEIEVFRSELRKSKTLHNQVRSDDPRQLAWVILQKDPETRKVLQKGPFLTEVVAAMIQAGEVKLSDYAWRSGMKEWYRIISLPELAGIISGAASRQAPAPTAAQLKDQQELLKNVLELQSEIVPPEETPEEAQNSVSVPLPGAKPAASPPKKIKSKLQRQRTIARRSYWPALLVVLLASIAAVGIAAVFLSKRQGIRVAAPVPQAEKAVPQPPSAPVVAQAPPVPTVAPTVAPTAKPRPKPTSAPTPTPEPRSKGSFIKIQLDSSTGHLKLVSDASSHYSPQVTFKSKMGGVIGAKSYFRTLRLKSRELNLRQLRWPEGGYDVTVKLGDLEAQRTVYVGSEPGDFANRSRAYRKTLSMDFMNEKVAMIRDAQKLYELSQQLLAAVTSGKSLTADWDSQYRKAGSRPLKNIGPKSRNSYILAEDWLGLKDDWRNLRKLRYKIASNSGRDEAKDELRALHQSLRVRVQQAREVSLWR